MMHHKCMNLNLDTFICHNTFICDIQHVSTKTKSFKPIPNTPRRPRPQDRQQAARGHDLAADASCPQNASCPQKAYRRSYRIEQLCLLQVDRFHLTHHRQRLSPLAQIPSRLDLYLMYDYNILSYKRCANTTLLQTPPSFQQLSTEKPHAWRLMCSSP